MGACVLSSAINLISLAKTQAICKKWSSNPSNKCYKGKALDTVHHLKMCCLGNQFVLSENEASRCIKATSHLHRKYKEVRHSWTNGSRNN